VREYEMMYILSPEVGDENYPAAIDKVNSLVSRLGGEMGEVNQSAPWGKRRLAYPIEKHNDGFYVVANFRINPSQTTELERSLRLNEEVLRHLLIVEGAES
jgi:small subunit ribosomal protein S6